MQTEYLKSAITNLYTDGIGYGYDADEVEALLDKIDFGALMQVIHHDMAIIHSFATQGRSETSFSYRGPDLFDEPAVRLFDVTDQAEMEDDVITTRSLELWILDDMTFETVVCVATSWRGGSFCNEYRFALDCDPWDSDLPMKLPALTTALRNMCKPFYDGQIPYYEL